MSFLTLKSPAKLNLTLHVKGKRPDGFHELETLFERIDLADIIILKTTTNGRITVSCTNPQVPCDQRNLVFRMAQKLKDDFKINQGIHIHIQKNIPMAAGLAGGSSNGATVLMGLNRLWDLNLGHKHLVRYASWLGSDVAFFLYDAPFALGRGRGELITPIKSKQRLWHVLVTPRVSMLTKDVFGALAKTHKGAKFSLTKKVPSVNILLPFLRQGDAKQLSGFLSNDLEQAIVALRPDFTVIKDKLQRAGALGVCFSGSGPSVYALAANQRHAQLIKTNFDKRFTQVFVVGTL